MKETFIVQVDGIPTAICHSKLEVIDHILAWLVQHPVSCKVMIFELNATTGKFDNGVTQAHILPAALSLGVH